jgi:hypothetical protein
MTSNKLKTVLMMLSVLLIIGAPYVSWLLVQWLQISATHAFFASLISLIAGLAVLTYVLRGQSLS